MAQCHELIFNTIGAKIPTFIVRFEDLRLNPTPALTDLFCFLLDVPSIEGTVAEQRIKLAVEQGSEKKTVYKLKSTSNNLNRNIGMYSEEQQARLKEALKDYNNFCGYTKDAEKGDDDENPTGFFDYA